MANEENKSTSTESEVINTINTTQGPAMDADPSRFPHGVNPNARVEPGAGGIGAKLRTEEVDPYHKSRKETPKVERPGGTRD